MQNDTTVKDGYQYRLEASVFQWKGSWHVLVVRHDGTARNRLLGRNRLVERHFERGDDTDEQFAVRELIKVLEAAADRMEGGLDHSQTA